MWALVLSISFNMLHFQHLVESPHYSFKYLKFEPFSQRHHLLHYSSELKLLVVLLQIIGFLTLPSAFKMELHKKIHHLFYNLLRKLFIACGRDIFKSSGFKPNYISFLLYIVNFVAYICCIYTVWTYEAAIGLHSFGVAAICIEVMQPN